MIKKTARKHATHKKTTARHSAKTHAKRQTTVPAPATKTWRPTQDGPESQTIGDESTLQIEASVRDDSDAEAGIYGIKRGETAG